MTIITTTTTTNTPTPTPTAKDNGVMTLTFRGHLVISHMTIRLVVVDFLWVVHCDHASMSGTVIKIWCLKVHVHRTTNRMTNLFISYNVHYVHTWQR